MQKDARATEPTDTNVQFSSKIQQNLIVFQFRSFVGRRDEQSQAFLKLFFRKQTEHRSKNDSVYKWLLRLFEILPEICAQHAAEKPENGAYKNI